MFVHIGDIEINHEGIELAELPDHLNITDITIQPLIQDINPM